MLVQGAKAVPPVLNYAGQVAVNGGAFEGTGQFKFALVDADGKVTYWSNDETSVGGLEPQVAVQVSVNGGLYSILLGNTAIQGMNALDPAIFQQYSDLKLRVWFSDGVNGFQQLSPDRPFASVPYAFSAGSAPIPQGSIHHSMLSIALRSDLNSSIKNITREILPDSVLADLNRSITRDMLPASVLADLNKSISRSDLPPSVLADLNRTITRDMLPASVLADLNKSIARSDLPSSVLADLNRTITKNNLGSDVLSDLNSSISLNRLSPEVLAALQVTPSISTQPFARYDWRTDSATIEARGRGHNLSYQWLKNGLVIAGANAPVLELSNPVLDDNATYAVQLTNSVGQTTSQTITLQDSSGLPLQEANATQVPRNGLVLWMDANDLNADGNADEIEIGNRIEYWADKITDKNASQSALNKQPLKVASGGVSFDGDDLLKISNLNVTAQHIIVVGSCNQIKGKLLHQGSLNLILIDETAGDFWEGGSNGHANKFNWRGAPVRVSSGPNELTINKPFVLSITRGDTSGSYSELNLADSFDGEISEILFYDRFLQNNERDAVEQHLAQKWGITLYPEQLTAEQAAYDAALPVNEPEDGLQAYYKFEPVSVEPNKLWDYSGNGRHLDLNGFTGEPWTEGVEGYSLLFDGINDKATGSFDGKFRTISFWLNSDTNVDGMSSHVTVLQGWGPHLHNDKQYLNLNKRDINGSGHFQFHKEYSTFIESSPDYNLTHSNWFHLALVASNDQGSDELSTQATYDFYINGNKIDVLRSNGNVGLLHTSRELNLGVGSFQGRLDEFRAYNRALLPFEVKAFYDSIKKPLIDLNFEHNATVGSAFSLSLAADNGPTTFLAEGLPAGLNLNTTTGQITGAISQPGYHRVFVKAMNEHGTGSDTIAIVARPQTDQYGWPVDVPDGSDIPQNGLVLWLDANDVDADGEFDTSTDHLKLANWADKAGSDHNATQVTVANQPEIRTGQISGKPNLNVLVFDGNQSLSFPTINQGRTFFWVLNRHAQGRSGANFIGNDTPDIWGNNQQSYYNTFQFTTTNNDVGTQIKNGVWSKNGLTGSSRDFFNFDQLPFVLSLVTEGMAPSKLIGQRGGSGQLFIGNIGEILIYDQALPINQIETVEKYLGQKWGVSISHDTTPSPTGNPPTFTVTPTNDSVTTAHLTEQILKYLKPEITIQPEATNVYSGSNHTFSVTAEGKYLTYQ